VGGGSEYSDTRNTHQTGSGTSGRNPVELPSTGTGRPVTTPRNEDAVLLAVLAVAGAALCYGASAVLQAAAVARSGRADLTGLVGGLARDPRYLSGLLLVAGGFLFSVVAIRALPLFVVQAGRASSLGVTAVLATLVLGTRLRRRESLALGGVAVGLVAVAMAATPQGPATVPGAVRWAVLAAAVLLAALTMAAVRTGPSARTAALVAALAGSCFGLLALSARVLGPIALPGVLTDPSAYAVGVAAAGGLLAGALALQRGSVVAVTTTMVATEAALGSLLGLAVGDRPADGLAWLAAAGFVVTVGSALLLARFGALENEADAPAGERRVPHAVAHEVD
jgi:drug/metabolite transporter (DMT)-like permease